MNVLGINWRRLRTLLVREVRATLRDPFTVTVMISVPIGALLLFGGILSTDVKHLPLGVLDASATPESRRLVADVTNTGAFDLRRYATRAALEAALVDGEVRTGIVIPPDFARQIERAAVGGPPPQVQALYDGGEAVLAGNAEGFLRGLTAASGAAPPAAGGVRVTTRALFNPTLDGRPFMVSGTFGFVLSFLTTLITAVSIVNERLAGTFDQLQVTPANSLEILLGKILPLGAVFALDVALMVVVAGLVLQVWPAGSVVMFLVISSVYVLVSLALGLVISATSSTTAEAVQKTVLTSIPLIQLSGFVFPTRNMPWLLGWATELLPATHYIRVSRAIYLRGEGLLTQLPDVLCIGLFGVVLMGMALRTMGRRT